METKRYDKNVSDINSRYDKKIKESIEHWRKEQYNASNIPGDGLLDLELDNHDLWLQMDRNMEIETRLLEYQRSVEIEALKELNAQNAASGSTDGDHAYEMYRNHYFKPADEADSMWYIPVWGEIEANHLRIPLVLDTEGGGFYLDGEKESVKEMSHHLMRVFLSFIPADGLNICVYDAKERGESISPFLDFMDIVKEVVSICDDHNDIGNLLAGLDSQIKECIQKKLRNRYHDIFEYNRETVGKSEKITLLVIYDFPYEIDTRSAELISRILEKGSKCGIFTVLCHCSDHEAYMQVMPDDRYLKNLASKCMIIKCSEDRYYWEDEDVNVLIREAPLWEEMDDFSDHYASSREKQLKSALPFESIYKGENGCDSTEVLKVPVGMGDGNKPVSVNFGLSDSYSLHGIIIGPSGTGKSTLLHTIIMSALLRYSPQELELYLLDFKQGAEFKIYSEYKLPQIRWIALHSAQEFGESILEEITRKMDERLEEFKRAGVQRIDEYRNKTNMPMPRILVIIDEFTELFNDGKNRDVARKCVELTNKILIQGRSSGIHLLMAAQALSNSSSMLNNVNLKIGLNPDGSDAFKLFGNYDATLKQLITSGSYPGWAVISEGNTGEKGVQIALCEKNRQIDYLRGISETYPSAEKPRIFDRNVELSLASELSKPDGLSNGKDSITLYLGEPIKIAPPIRLSLDNTSKHILVCGHNSDMEKRLMEDFLVCALYNERSSVYCVDAGWINRRSDENTERFYGALRIPGGRFRLADNDDDVLELIKEVYGIYIERRDKKTDTEPVLLCLRKYQGIDAIRDIMTGKEPDRDPVSYEENPVFKMLNGIGEVSDMKSENSVSFKTMLTELLSNGHRQGIHFIVSESDWGEIKSWKDYFAHKLIFNMSEEDSFNLTRGNVKTENLIDRAVYYVDTTDKAIQIRPYKELHSDELQRFVDNMR